MQADFERELSKKIFARRLITGCLALVFLALFLLFFFLREASKTVTVHDAGYSTLSWTKIQYDNSYIPFIVISFFGCLISTIALIVDLMMCGYKTICKDQHCITLYRGMARHIVYVDGQEKGRVGPFSLSNVVEVWLPNRVQVTVSVSRTIWYIAHVSFSDNTASIEV